MRAVAHEATWVNAQTAEEATAAVVDADAFLGKIKPEMLAWIDYAEWNQNEWTCEWRIETKMFTESVKCGGKNRYVVTPDGKVLVFTREGASDRKNGIVICSLEGPAHPKVISGYTATVTGGVHSTFSEYDRMRVRECGAGRRRTICGPSETGRSYL